MKSFFLDKNINSCYNKSMKRNKKKFVEVPLHIVDNGFDFSSLKEDEEDIYLTHENFEKISIYAVRKHITFDEAITKIIKKGMAMLPAWKGDISISCI